MAPSPPVIGSETEGAGQIVEPMSDNFLLPDTPCNRLQDPSLDPLVAEYLLASRSANTRRAYEADLRHFRNWGGQLPSTPEDIARYLAHSAGQLRPVTLRRRLAALASAHRDAGLLDPTKAPLVHRVRQGIERRHACIARQVAPLMLDDLRQIVTTLRDTPDDRRDHALLLVGFFGALRRSEIVALDVDDLQINDDGVIVWIRKSKTDQLRRGRILQLPRFAEPLDVVSALRRWLLHENIAEGAVFRTPHTDRRLSTRSVARGVKRRVSAIGLDSRIYSGHSLRAGLATSAALAGYDATLIARVTGHKSQTMVANYVRP